MRSVNLILIGLALGGFFRPAHTAWAQAPVPSGTVITIAGNGVGGFSGDGGPALDASNSGPYGSAIGPDGTLYFADNGNFRIRAVNPATGIITTVAGNGSIGDHNSNNGPATDADLGGVLGIAVDRDRNALYIGDIDQNWVSKVDLSTNLLSRYAGTGIFDGGLGFNGDGGPATSASLDLPYILATDAIGNLYFSDIGNFRIRRVDPAGIITTIAGNGDAVSAGNGGPATAASLSPTSVAADSDGNIFVIDSGFLIGGGENPLIRRIDAITGIITTVAGGGATTPGTGPATDMHLGAVFAIAVDDDGTLFIGGGSQASQVFKVDLGTGQLSPFAGAADPGNSGDGGPALDARFGAIGGLTVAPGGGLIISDLDNARIRYIAPDSIHLSGDSGQTDFYLPWVSAISGELIITNNPNLLTIDLSSLGSVGGDISIDGNTAAGLIDLFSLESAGLISITDNMSATTIDLGSLGNVGGDIEIIDNTAAEAVDLSSLGSVGGDIDISGNTSAGTIDLSSLVSTIGAISIVGNSDAGLIDLLSLESAGLISITDNMSATTIDLGSLGNVGGDIEIIDNTAAGTVDLGSLGNVGGDIDISGNTSAGTIDLSSLVSTIGSIDITDNTSATVDLSSLATAGGDVTIETIGSGTFDVSSAAVGGDTDLTTDGYTQVDAATAGGETAVTMLNSAAKMEVTLPDGALPDLPPGDKVTFSVQKLPGGGVETVDGELVTQLETYAFDFAIPTLNLAATLNFEINLVALDEPDRLALVDLLHQSAELTIGVRGDAPGAELQLFDVCSGTGATVDSCVVVQWLDETRMVLVPSAGVDPSILRFEALVGHFSTYSVVAVGLAGDYNHNGVVDAADYTVWRDGLGSTYTLADYDVWKSHFGNTNGNGSGADQSAVPEPSSAVLLLFSSVVFTLRVKKSSRGA